MATRHVLPTLVALSLLPAVPLGAAEEICIGVFDVAECSLVAVSLFGTSSGLVAVSGTGESTGTVLAASGTGDANTEIFCLEWICPSVAASVAGDAHAACYVSTVCLAASVFGHASHEGFGASVNGCDEVPRLCGLP